MPKEPETANYDYSAQLAEAIRLLAERVTPRPLHPTANQAIKNHEELTKNLQFVFEVTPPPPTDKY